MPLSFFLLTASSLGAALEEQRGDDGSMEASQLDVKFSPLYLSFLNVVKVLMTVTLTLYSDSPAGVLGVCLFCGVALFVWTLVFGRLTETEVRFTINPSFNQSIHQSINQPIKIILQMAILQPSQHTRQVFGTKYQRFHSSSRETRTNSFIFSPSIARVGDSSLSRAQGPSCIRAATDLRAGGFLALAFASCVSLVELSIRNGSSSIAVDTGAVLVIGLGVIAFLTLAVAAYHTYANRLRYGFFREMWRAIIAAILTANSLQSPLSVTAHIL